jgi:hypothetical protein
MRSFIGVGDRFLRDLRTVNGTLVRGTFMPASDREGSALNYSAPRSILRTRPEAEIRAGVVVISREGGPLYIIGEHFAAEPDYRSWRVFLVEAKYKLERPTSGVDTLTGLKKGAGLPQDLGDIYVSMEYDRRMFTDPGLRIKTERVTLITNREVQVGDLINGERITRVTQDLGLYVVEHD